MSTSPICRRMCWYCGCNTSVDSPRRTARRLCRRPDRRDRLRHRPYRPETPGRTPPFRRRHPDHPAARRIRATDDRDPARLRHSPRSRDRHRDRSADARPPATVGALSAAGVTRASIGVQSLDPAVQTAINRVQSFAVTTRAVDDLRRAGVQAINLDLIYGLPCQTVAVVPRHGRAMPDAPAGPLRGLRLCPRTGLQETPAQDRRRRAARRRGTERPVGSHRRPHH